MTDLSTIFAGMRLRSPLIVSSSGLSSSVDRIRKMAQSGAGAVVLKSLFEEQIMYEAGKVSSGSDYPEANDYIMAYTRQNSLEDYLSLIGKAKASVDVPVIASINCVRSEEWTGFSHQIEEAGADALELNIYFLPIDKQKEPREYESAYLDLVSAVRKKTSLPLIVKLGSSFSNITWMVQQLYVRGASGVVMFNRFYAPDINTDDFTLGSSEVLSSPADLRLPLRWIGIVSSQVKEIDLGASTGVHSGMAAVKLILAGAAAVQVCSVLYRNGIEYLKEMNAEIKKWMEKNQFRSISGFRGKMNYGSLEDPSVYERSQFMKYFSQMH